MVNRRRFVYGMLSAAALVPGLAGRARAAQTASLPSLRGPLGKDVFLGLRQQMFTAVIDERRSRWVLVGVTDDGCCPDREQFTVLFRAPRDLHVTDGPCLLSHPTAGSTPLYVQRVGADARGSYYRAVFNLLS